MNEEAAEEGLDPRVRRTRKWLRQALTTLLQEKPYAEISITDITREADLARVTFYQHFESKEALLLSVVAEFFAQIYEAFDMQRFQEFVEEGTLETAARVNAARMVTPDQLMLMRVALQEIGPALRELLVESFMQMSVEHRIVDERQQRLLATYHVGGTLALMERFLQGDMPLASDGRATIPVIFLRALRLEAVQNGLLGEALSQRDIEDV